MGKTIYVKCGCCPKDTHDLKVDITGEIAQAKQEATKELKAELRKLKSNATFKEQGQYKRGMLYAVLRMESKLKAKSK